MKTLFTLTIMLFGLTFASAQTEQAPLQEKEIKYKDWTYKSIRDDKNINLREFAQKQKTRNGRLFRAVVSELETRSTVRAETLREI